MGKNNSILKTKSVLLLLIFVFLKVGIAHSLTHTFSHDDINDCEQCVLIVNSNKTKAFNGHLSASLADVEITQTIQKPLSLLYKNPLFKAQYYVLCFNKPPPSFCI